MLIINIYPLSLYRNSLSMSISLLVIHLQMCYNHQKQKSQVCNMKVYVFSDTHHRTSAMEQEIIADPPDAIIHLGDYMEDTFDLRSGFPDIPLYSVPGNCDFRDGGVEELALLGHRLLLCHGHQFGVKLGLDRLRKEGMRRGVDAVLFGHTHNQYLDDSSTPILLNPGSAQGILSLHYAVLHLTSDGLRAEMISKRT